MKKRINKIQKFLLNNTSSNETEISEKGIFYKCQYKTQYHRGKKITYYK